MPVLTREDRKARDAQVIAAKQLMRERGPAALNNPHAMIGRECGCGTCFCCAALYVFRHEPRIAGVTIPAKEGEV